MDPVLPSPGDVIDGCYELELLAAQGGMGTVWRARDVLLGATVALKIVDCTHPGVRARFRSEAAALSMLSHDAIVRYAGHGSSRARPGCSWIVTEWIEGESLAERLARGPLALDETVALALRLSEGLGAVHARGMAHRDVKPGNVMLPAGRLDEAKLVDFGIACGHWGDVAEDGVVMGTAGYMAPERACSRGEVDARCDVYSLGCLLFECLTGRSAFAVDDDSGWSAVMQLDEAPRVSELVAGVPPELDELVARMLSAVPEERPADGNAVHAWLRALSAAVPMITGASRPRSSPSRAPEALASCA